MDKKLQDHVWSILPKEFKEEVNKMWQSADKEQQLPHDAFLRGEYSILVSLFGYHNLTSDAEGEEEMLMCKRKDIQYYYQYHKAKSKAHLSVEQKAYCKGRAEELLDLFGSKCLPDEAQSKQKDCDNPLADKEGCRWCNDGKCAFDSACYFEPLNPQEPKSFKYKVGQKVILHFYGGEVSTITEAFNDGGVWNKYKVKMLPTRVWNENELDPYEEPKPAEPKFKIGEFAMFNGRKVEIIGYSDHRPQIYRIHVFTENYQTKVHEFDLEPCTEPKNEHNTDNAVQKSANVNSNHSQDHIGNANEMVSKSPNRLHIAAMAMQGMLANEGVSCFTDVQELEHMDFITYHAFEYADKLIKKANQDEQD